MYKIRKSNELNLFQALTIDCKIITKFIAKHKPRNFLIRTTSSCIKKAGQPGWLSCFMVTLWFRLESDDFLRLGAFLAFGHNELNALSFFQFAETIGLNGRVMYEDILTTFTFDETETFDIVKPFDGALDFF